MGLQDWKDCSNRLLQDVGVNAALAPDTVPIMLREISRYIRLARYRAHMDVTMGGNGTTVVTEVFEFINTMFRDFDIQSFYNFSPAISLANYVQMPVEQQLLNNITDIHGDMLVHPEIL